MMRGLYAAARGMQVQGKAQELITNNMANSNTAGFKKDVALIRSFPEWLIARMERGRMAVLGRSGQGALLDDTVTLHDPGSLEETGRSLDFAVDGDGFFVVATPQGNRYTRDGSFTLDAHGFLVTGNGYFVLDEEGNPLYLGTDEVTVDNYGTIRRKEDGTVAGRIMVALFGEEDLAQLQKRGENLFEADGIDPLQAAGLLRQGYLENANVNAVKEMVGMLAARAALFEAAAATMATPLAQSMGLPPPAARRQSAPKARTASTAA